MYSGKKENLYLYGATRNRSLQYLEHREVRYRYRNTVLAGENPESESYTPQDQLEYKELQSLVNRALGKLSSRSSVEMADAKSRPTLSSKAANLADYDTVYIGFPIWWNLAPRIINTFIESGDFSGKTVILFATSGGSSISNSEKELQKTYSNLKWQKGKLLNGATKEDIKQWTKK